MNKEKIILIEDDYFLATLYKDALIRAEYDVLLARDGEEALNLIKENVDASLILLDLILPKINGIDVLKEIKNDPKTKNLSVIVLSNLNEESLKQESLRLGANAFLVKAESTPAQIIETAKQYIDLRNYIKKQQ